MIAWMLRALLVSGIASGAAYCFERALRNRGMATRFAWLFSIVASVLLPFVPRLSSAPALPAVIPVIPVPVLELAAPAAAPVIAFPTALVTWLLLSALAAVLYLIAYVRLRRVRREWRAASLEQHDVLVSPEYGPAVCGFRRPRIVVPGWVFGVGALERRLIVLHEAEHIRARDQVLVLAALAATVVMPWNPFVWLQIRRMRFAVEADCDQRVLASTGDPEQYASLLLDVGRRHSGIMFSPALAERRHGLEKRIAIMARSAARNRWSALAFALGGALLGFVACESRLPMATQQRGAEQPAMSKEAPKQPWIFGEAEYPPELRAAGIGGTVSLRIHVTNGGVADQAEITKSSGNTQLDAAAIRAVKNAEWANDGPLRHTDYWTTTGVTFNPKQREALRTAEKQRRPSTTMAPTPGSQDGERPKMTDQPSFTPITTQPQLLNREEVTRALVSNYPPLLKNAGVGGKALMWVLVDERGAVVKSQVKASSGEAALDAAALQVAGIMKFSPALNRTEAVPAWIQLPIVFATH